VAELAFSVTFAVVAALAVFHFSFPLFFRWPILRRAVPTASRQLKNNIKGRKKNRLAEDRETPRDH
ncbi:MAG: hypothetical protein J6T51_01795, partial [Kiritimatiellae bacterium]|nr:hypothetical protein [Kiritimatiellia bacterium]